MLEALVISQILLWVLVLSMALMMLALLRQVGVLRTDRADGRAYAGPRTQGGRARAAVRGQRSPARHPAQARRPARPQHAALLSLADLPGVQKAAADRQIDPAGREFMARRGSRQRRRAGRARALHPRAASGGFSLRALERRWDDVPDWQAALWRDDRRLGRDPGQGIAQHARASGEPDRGQADGSPVDPAVPAIQTARGPLIAHACARRSA